MTIEREELEPCANCGKDTDWLALFPGHICLTCYEQTEDARRPLTAADVRGMWGMDR